ncbi:MAG: TIR domain-containing protein [Fibromonadaceae bacterium]|jgi:hypothetical protein|nr:TIR domain-containing protein [Fibromonadaceae bacterium]
MAQKYDIFISYRRKGGVQDARMVDIKLREMGYYVSFDIDTLGKGKFTDTLRTRLKDCKDFIVIFEPTYYERFYEADSLDEKGNVKPGAKVVSEEILNEDWCYLELKNALHLNKNIIPLIRRDFRFPNNLPKEVKDIAEMNAIEVTEKEFKEIFENKVPLYLNSKPKFTHRHKKSITAVLTLAIVAIVAYLVFMWMDSNKKAAETTARAAAEIAAGQERARLEADSIRKVKEAEIEAERRRSEAQTQGIFDSLKANEAAKRAAAAAAAAASASRRELHWVGNGDETGNALFNKLSRAGLSTNRCTGNGIKITASSRPACTPTNISIRCAYTPQLTITTCDGAPIDRMVFGQAFSGTDNKGEAAARQKMLEALQAANFGNWVRDIQSLRNR